VVKNPYNILLGTGILLLVAGVAGSGLTYRDIRTENLLHAKMAPILIPFADTPASASANFLPYRGGVYSIYISGQDPEGGAPPPAAGCAPESLPASLRDYEGVVDILVRDPRGDIVINRRISPGEAFPMVKDSHGWISVDTLSLGTDERQWTLGVSVRPEGSPRPECGMSLFILPPQRYDIGAYLADGIVRLVAFGACMFIGFALIVFSGRARR
jgi:hypothetical protein